MLVLPSVTCSPQLLSLHHCHSQGLITSLLHGLMTDIPSHLGLRICNFKKLVSHFKIMYGRQHNFSFQCIYSFMISCIHNIDLIPSPALSLVPSLPPQLPLPPCQRPSCSHMSELSVWAWVGDIHPSKGDLTSATALRNTASFLQKPLTSPNCVASPGKVGGFMNWPASMKDCWWA